ncbi:uncharacterized protein LOC129971938 [Argiope bruennichi]|uniref:uncharacterized protein LOC129971938 n=1 Tax=Argiope bruennichi TaxID=94029 RepID=UPI002494588E|nr:uncharacterized protein LOC129971938 [Argiope bruennichi]
MGFFSSDTEPFSETARFVILSIPDGKISQLSPFAVEKALKGIGGSPKSVKKLRSGDLLIETTSALQTKSFLQAKSFLNHPVSVTLHRTLNFCRGVISEKELLSSPESEILDGLASQGVIAVKRIFMKKGNTLVATNSIILTFNTTKLPSSIKAGYLNCKVRPYIPNPIRCYNCQRFGHSKTACRGTQTCSRCATAGHQANECTADPQCEINAAISYKPKKQKKERLSEEDNKGS